MIKIELDEKEIKLLTEVLKYSIYKKYDKAHRLHDMKPDTDFEKEYLNDAEILNNIKERLESL